MAKSYLSLGSNMGDRQDFLNQAIKYIGEVTEISVIKVSSFYETDPVGYLDQDLFLNVAIEIDTMLEPKDLLLACQNVENILHRKRVIRWGPRTVDIDIIFYDNLKMASEILEIPHPRALERGFVMWPIFEIAEDLIVQGRTINEIMKSLPKEGIRKI